MNIYLRLEDEDDPLFKILSWRDPLKEIPIPPADSFLYKEVPSVVTDDQSGWGSNFQGILLDVDWQTTDFQ